MNRNQFLNVSCRLCLLGAAGIALPSLLGCGATKTAAYRVPVLERQMRIPLAALEADGSKIVRPEGWDYDVAVHKTATGYDALLLKCTHMDNPLYASGTGWACHQHGSLFNAEGQVRKGPAEEPLVRYRTEVVSENLIIYT
ncbi:MAG: hypothetical protein EOP52_00350 [Sphingobacteriales bacterium]|nr:MAG: hypothetical protein EOP52_00350 [Sphingobacteriales bacterium]